MPLRCSEIPKLRVSLQRARLAAQARARGAGDPRREFFLHHFAHDEKDGIKALTRTYTWQVRRNATARELIGYVPWQFNLPEKGKGMSVRGGS